MLEKGGVRMAGRQDYEERKERKIDQQKNPEKIANNITNIMII